MEAPSFATDIIEDVDDDRGATAEIARELKPGGNALITVPGFQQLWGLQKRKAHKTPLPEERAARGPALRRIGAGAKLLFQLPALHLDYLARRATDRLGLELDSEGQVNTRLVNRMLQALFVLEASIAPLIHPPFGVPIFVLVAQPSLTGDSLTPLGTDSGSPYRYGYERKTGAEMQPEYGMQIRFWTIQVVPRICTGPQGRRREVNA